MPREHGKGRAQTLHVGRQDIYLVDVAPPPLTAAHHHSRSSAPLLLPPPYGVTRVGAQARSP